MPVLEPESIVLPNPLHPAIVHFPVVLAFVLPLLVAGAFWAIRRGANTRRAWAAPLATAVALALSAWAAVETGGADSERVERVVAEQTIESHEEMAEALLAVSAAVALVAVAGLAGGAVGKTARVVTAVGALTVVVLVARVGHSGGQLVYRYGAADAYTSRNAVSSGEVSGQAAARRDGRRTPEHEGR